MSDIGLTRSNADAVLKEFYISGIREQLNNEVFMLTQVEMNTRDIEGRRAILSLHVGRNQGVGARAELGTLPTAGRQKYAEERVWLKYLYGRIQLSGPVIRSMASDQGSFIRAVDSETTGVTRDLRKDVNRQIYGDGTGTIAVAASNSGAVVTLQNATAAQLRSLEPGMTVDIGTAADPTASGTATIISVDRSGPTVTLDSTVTVNPGDIITREGSGGEGADQKEITGLQAQVAADGVLWNVDPATYPVWKSYVNDAVGGVSEDAYIEASQEVAAESGEMIDLWVTTAAVHRWTANLLTSIKRFPNTLELKGGYKGLDMSDVSQGNSGVNEVAMVWDADMSEEGTAYGLTKSTWQCYSMSDWEFMQEDGAVLNRVPNTDAYEATLFRYMELATDKRNANAKLSGITES